MASRPGPLPGSPAERKRVAPKSGDVRDGAVFSRCISLLRRVDVVVPFPFQGRPATKHQRPQEDNSRHEQGTKRINAASVRVDAINANHEKGKSDHETSRAIPGGDRDEKLGNQHLMPPQGDDVRWQIRRDFVPCALTFSYRTLTSTSTAGLAALSDPGAVMRDRYQNESPVKLLNMAPLP